MSEENENTIEQTEVSAPESSPAPAEQSPPTSQRLPESGFHVLYVDEERILDANVQAGFTDGSANLRVFDPSMQLGQFDISRVAYDANKTKGTFHFTE